MWKDPIMISPKTNKFNIIEKLKNSMSNTVFLGSNDDYLTKLNYMFRNELGKESEVKDKFFEMIESNPKLEKAIFESNFDFDFDNLFHPGGFLDKISETDAKNIYKAIMDDEDDNNLKE
jgi:hypothetical protein